MDLNNFFSPFVSIAGGMALFIGSIAFAYKTWKDTTSKVDTETIDRLKDAINSLKEENSILRTENIALKLKALELDKSIIKAQADIQVLQGLVTGRDVLEKMTTKLDMFDKRLLQDNQKILAQLEKISNSLTK